MSGFDAAYIATKSLIFGSRRVGGAADDPTKAGSYVVATAQGYNGAKAGAKLIGIHRYAEGMAEAAQASPGLAKTATALEWAGKNVNPLIVLASLYKVFSTNKAERLDVATQEGIALPTMFLAENFIKKNDKAISKVIDEIPLSGKAALLKPVLKGLVFVGASIAGYKAGSVAGAEINNIRHGIEEPPTPMNVMV